MIFKAAHDERRAIQVLANTGQVRIQTVSHMFFFQKGNPILGGEYDVQIKLAKDWGIGASVLSCATLSGLGSGRFAPPRVRRRNPGLCCTTLSGSKASAPADILWDIRMSQRMSLLYYKATCNRQSKAPAPQVCPFCGGTTKECSPLLRGGQATISYRSTLEARVGALLRPSFQPGLRYAQKSGML